VLYAASFPLPAIQIIDDRLTGWQAFLTSPGLLWRDFLEPALAGDLSRARHAVGHDLPWATFAWLPNPLLWLGIIGVLTSRWRLAAIAGVAAVLVGSVILILASLGEGFVNAGGWLWLASMGTLVGVVVPKIFIPQTR
jgi:hypothetical protein